LSGLEPRTRGRKVADQNHLKGEVERLHKENDRLKKRLRQAEIIIDVQKKASEMVGIALETIEAGEKS